MKTKNEMLDRMIFLAVMYHNGVKDKAGDPYILHPLEVMHNVETIEEKIVAIGHDLIEDTGLTLKLLEVEGFSEDIIDAMDAITKRKDETYEEYLIRAISNNIARRVKEEDINHNSSKTRLERLKDKIREKLEKKYEFAKNFMGKIK